MACTALARVLAFAILLCLPLASHAIFRAYVSSTGDDANPCTLQQPCRLLPKALAVVDSGGEIWMLDSANYNTSAVTVTKSVSIQAIPGAVGSVVGAPDAIVVGAGVVVALRNLSITPFSGSGSGVEIAGDGARVFVERCVISRMGKAGIHLAGDSTAFVIDTIIRRSGFDGITAWRGKVHVTRSHLLANQGSGLQASPTTAGHSVVAHLVDSVASGNGQHGFVAQVTSLGGNARLYVSRTTASQNQLSGYGVLVVETPTDAILEISNSVADDNNTYGIYNNGGTVRSSRNNRLEGNGIGATYGPIGESEGY